MALSERLTGGPEASLAKRTVLYVLAFGLGALAVAVSMSFTFVSIAEGVLPATDAEAPPAGKPAPEIIGEAPGDGPSSEPSNAGRSRGNDAADGSI